MSTISLALITSRSGESVTLIEKQHHFHTNHNFLTNQLKYSPGIFCFTTKKPISVFRGVEMML